MAAGVAISVWGGVRIVHTVDDFETIRGTTEGRTVSLSETGQYSVFIDGLGIGDESDIPAVVAVVEDPSGRVQRILPDRGEAGDLSYMMSGASGARLGTFEAREPGSYRISLESGIGGEPGNFPIYTLHVGRLDVGGAVAAVVAGFVIGGVFTLAAIVLLVVTAVRRSSHRRRMALAAPYGYGYGWSVPVAPGAWMPPTDAAGAVPGWVPPPPGAPPPPAPPPATPWSHTNPPGWWTPPSETPAPSSNPSGPDAAAADPSDAGRADEQARDRAEVVGGRPARLGSVGRA